MFLSFITNLFRSSNQITDGWLAVCLTLTKRWEGCSLEAYWDAIGGVWTIGYGATGPHITKGTVWTQAQCDQDLTARLSLLGDEVDGAMEGVVLNDNQKAAIVDFCYEEGIGRFLKSSVLMYLKEKDFKEAMERILLYDKAGGVDVAGIENRRKAEVSLFDA